MRAPDWIPTPTTALTLILATDTANIRNWTVHQNLAKTEPKLWIGIKDKKTQIFFLVFAENLTRD